jgi:PAS domain S-box-containing protein
VTDRREAEEALRESQRRLELATEAAALGIYDYDVRSGELEADKRVRDLWGMGAFGSMSFAALINGVHPEDRAVLQQAVDDVLDPAQGPKFSVSHRVLSPRDGSVRWIHTTGQAVFEGDEGVRLVGTVEDITERVRAEEVLRRQDMERAGQEERSRLARDLHDSVTQALFASSLRAEALASADSSERSLANFNEVHRLNRGALAQMRSMLLELRGDPVADVPLQQLLRNAVEATESRCSANITLSMGDVSGLSRDVHEAVYRITQEALNNVARHAHASHVLVRFEVDGDARPRLTIEDDGRGFDPGSVGPGHFGLVSMRERARESGADLRIESGDEQGTAVVASWRLEPAGDGEARG